MPVEASVSSKSPNQETDAEVMARLGGRLRSAREVQRLTTIEAAARAGLSRRTVYRAEQGANPTLASIVRLLRLYGRLDELAGFLPEPELSPMALIKGGKSGRRRRPRG